VHLGKREFKEFVSKELPAFYLFEVTKYLLGWVIASGIFVVLFKMLSSNIIYIRPYTFLFSIIIIAACLLISIYLFEKHILYRPFFPPLDPEYKVLDKEVTYEYLDDIEIVYSRKFIIQALKSGINRIEQRYHWTGSGPKTIECPIPGVHYEDTQTKGIWQFGDIRFDKTLDKNDQQIIEIIFKLRDEGRTAKPHLATFVDVPTRKLIQRVVLPLSFGVAHGYCDINMYKGAIKPYKSSDIDFVKIHERFLIAEWVVPNPHLLFEYAIKWSRDI
jgi:hypothetical protein